MKYRGNFFSLPNEIFLLGLSPGELAVYCYLRRCENQKTHQCWPSYKTIGNAVGMCENTVNKYTQKLIERGLIAVEPTKVTTKAGVTRNGTLQFTVLPPQDVVAQPSRRTAGKRGRGGCACPRARGVRPGRIGVRCPRDREYRTGPGDLGRAKGPQSQGVGRLRCRPDSRSARCGNDGYLGITAATESSPQTRKPPLTLEFEYIDLIYGASGIKTTGSSGKSISGEPVFTVCGQTWGQRCWLCSAAHCSHP